MVRGTEGGDNYISRKQEPSVIGPGPSHSSFKKFLPTPGQTQLSAINPVLYNLSFPILTSCEMESLP